jgi:hypothetical protein
VSTSSVLYHGLLLLSSHGADRHVIDTFPLICKVTRRICIQIFGLGVATRECAAAKQRREFFRGQRERDAAG